MTHRTKRIAGGLSGLALLARLAVAVWPTSNPYPCRAKFDRVKVGMTRSEVIAMAGGSPGDYTIGEVISSSDISRDSTLPDPEQEQWLANDGELAIRFNADGVAESVRVWDVWLRRPSLLARLRSWLGL